MTQQVTLPVHTKKSSITMYKDMGHLLYKIDIQEAQLADTAQLARIAS